MGCGVEGKTPQDNSYLKLHFLGKVAMIKTKATVNLSCSRQYKKLYYKGKKNNKTTQNYLSKRSRTHNSCGC